MCMQQRFHSVHDAMCALEQPSIDLPCHLTSFSCAACLCDWALHSAHHIAQHGTSVPP